MQKRFVLLIGFVFALLTLATAVIAQRPTVITVTAPQYLNSVFEDIVIPAFEDAHPDIQVEFVYSENDFITNPLYRSDDEETTFFEDLAAYTSSADVLYVQDAMLSPFETTTGFYLDLAPLISTDEDIVVDDFYPAAWDAFQWDGGVPADLTQLDNPALVADQGEDVVAFYRAITEPFTAPNTLVLPGVYGGVPSISAGAWLEPTFFYRALDAAVLDGVDLTTALEDAESNIAVYRECTAGLEQLTPAEVMTMAQDDDQRILDYYRQFVDCAVSIVPELRETFSYYYE